MFMQDADLRGKRQTRIQTSHTSIHLTCRDMEGKHKLRKAAKQLCCGHAINRCSGNRAEPSVRNPVWGLVSEVNRIEESSALRRIKPDA